MDQGSIRFYGAMITVISEAASADQFGNQWRS